MPAQRLEEMSLLTFDDAATARSGSQDERQSAGLGLANELCEIAPRILEKAGADSGLDQIRQHWTRSDRVPSHALAARAPRVFEGLDGFVRTTKAQREQAECRPADHPVVFLPGKQRSSFHDVPPAVLLAAQDGLDPREPVERVDQLALLPESPHEGDGLACC